MALPSYRNACDWPLAVDTQPVILPQLLVT